MMNLVVRWCGENGSPSGADLFNGDSKEAQGPYVLAGGHYYSIGTIREFCRAVGLVLVDEVQRDFEKMAAEITQLRAQNADLTTQTATADGDRRDAVEQLEAVQGELTVAREELERTKTTAAVAAEYLAAHTPKTKGGK